MPEDINKLRTLASVLLKERNRYKQFYHINIVMWYVFVVTVCLASLLNAGCATKVPTGISFADGFASWQKEAVLDALAALPKKGQVEALRFSFLPPESFVSGLACVGCDPCFVQLHPRLLRQYYGSVVWHEYGHCKGLQHEESGVMAPSVHPLPWYSESEKLDFLEKLEK